MIKRTLAVLVALSGWNGTAGAQECAPAKIAITVALNQIGGTDLMTVPVVIDGTTKQFLLDISMKPSQVSQATATALGLPEDPKLTSWVNGYCQFCDVRGVALTVHDLKSGLGSGGANTRVRIGTFTIGDAATHQLQLLVSKDKDMGRSEPYDGLLTGDFFKQYDVALDFAGKKMTYLTPTNCTGPDQVVFWPHSSVGIIPVTLADDGKLQVQVMANGHIINAQIDTSSARTVMRRGVAERQLGFEAGKDMVPQGDLKDTMGQQVYGHTFPQIIFAGGVAAANVPVLIQDYSMTREDREPVLGSRAQFANADIPDLTIGMDVLHRLHMYVVFGQGKLYVTSAQ